MANEIDTEKYNQLILDLRAAMKLASTRNVIWYILSLCGIYNDQFTGNAHTYYLLGKKAIGTDILQLMEDADFRMYTNLLIEMNTKKEENHD